MENPGSTSRRQNALQDSGPLDGETPRGPPCRSHEKMPRTKKQAMPQGPNPQAWTERSHFSRGQFLPPWSKVSSGRD